MQVVEAGNQGHAACIHHARAAGRAQPGPTATMRSPWTSTSARSPARRCRRTRARRGSGCRRPARAPTRNSPSRAKTRARSQRHGRGCRRIRVRSRNASVARRLREPVCVAEEAVSLVGEDELAIGDMPGGQLAGEEQRLREIDIAVVVAVDQQHRRAPAVDRAERRGVPLQLARRRPAPRARAMFGTGRSIVWTPWKSTPAANRSLSRASASAVR